VATGNSLVTDTLTRIVKLPSGGSATTQELSDGVSELNRMLGSWNAEMGPIFAETLDSLTWTGGSASMTIGTSGSFNVSRPMKILGAQYRDSSNVDHNMQLISHAEYQSAILKTIQIDPYWAQLAYNPTYTSSLGTLYILPVPVSSFTFRLNSLKPLADLTGAGTVVLPPGFEDAIIMNLAPRLAGVYGYPVTAIMVQMAAESKKAIVEAAIQFENGHMDPLAPGMPNGYNPRAYWNI
jgi:hypothetical protein